MNIQSYEQPNRWNTVQKKKPSKINVQEKKRAIPSSMQFNESMKNNEKIENHKNRFIEFFENARTMAIWKKKPLDMQQSIKIANDKPTIRQPSINIELCWAEKSKERAQLGYWMAVKNGRWINQFVSCSKRFIESKLKSFHLENLP